MGLEAPAYLDEFNPDNPTYQDFIEQGDDHIRRMKAALKATFPGMAGKAWRKRSISVSGPINLTDNMTLLYVNGGLTMVPAAASVLGNGWMTMVRANGGTVTINPGENINGAGSIAVPAGYTAIVFSDGTEFFAMLVYQDVPPSVKSFVTGTKMLFQQTAAPTGWTKNTSSVNNDAAIRLTTGTVGTGGADVFVGVFGAGKTTSGFSLSAAHNGPHSHNLAGGSPVLSGGGTDLGLPGGGGTNSQVYGSPATDSSGSGSAHSHTIPTMNIKYVDCIVASID